MGAISLLRAALVVGPYLLQLVAADTPNEVVKPADPVPTASQLNKGSILADCDPRISVCRKKASVHVVHTHRETLYVTNKHVFEDVTTLSPVTETITSISVSTVTTKTEGHCQDTTTITHDAPLIVTVDFNTTTTRSFIPVIETTTVSIKTIYAKKIEQCIVRGHDFAGHGHGHDYVYATKPALPDQVRYWSDLSPEEATASAESAARVRMESLASQSREEAAAKTSSIDAVETTTSADTQKSMPKEAETAYTDLMEGMFPEEYFVDDGGVD